MDMAFRRYKKELAGQLGNLLSRSTSSALNPTGTIPPGIDLLHGAPEKPLEGPQEEVEELYTSISLLPSLYEKCMEEGHPGKAVAAIFDMLAKVLTREGDGNGQDQDGIHPFPPLFHSGESIF